MTSAFRTGLAAVAASLGLWAAAHAQPLPGEPQVIRWPGGQVVVNGTEVTVRQGAPGRSTTVVTGAGNGVGNRIVVDNGGGGGVTVVRGSRVGIGNRLVIDPDELLVDLDAFWCRPKPAPLDPMVPPKAPADPLIPPAEAALPLPPAPEPAAVLSHKGKAAAFWTKKAFSDALDCNLYWDPAAKLWFRYHAEDDAYRPVATQPAAPADGR